MGLCVEDALQDQASRMEVLLERLSNYHPSS